MKIGKLVLLFLFAVTLMAARGCQIGNGTIEGTVTDSVTNAGLAGVEVTVTPGIIISTSQTTEPVVVTTDASGAYSASVSAGSYTLSFALANYQTAQGSAAVSKRVTTTVDAVLEPLSIAGKGTIQGTVTNSLTDAGIAGVSVNLTSSQGAAPVVVTTDASGAYSALVPEGSYTLEFALTNYQTANDTATVDEKTTTTVNAALEPVAPVVVNAGPDQEGEFGASINLNGSVQILDGSTLESVEWTQTTGPAAAIAAPASEDTTATLPTYEVSKGALLAGLEQLDRLMVQGINPHALEGAKTDTFKITVKTSSGTYSDSAIVELPLPLQVTTGIRNVPINVPVLLHGTDDPVTFGWEILSKPAESAAILVDSTTQDPYFTPDVAGAYAIEQEGTEATITIIAGTYVGGINGQDANGNPTMTCSQCHSSTVAEWAPSGHAHIFSDNVNTSDHYSESCLPCHTVGYLSGANGIDQASDWDAFIESGLLTHSSPTNWTTILADYPQTAQLSNIQCENCHGPQSPGHTQGRELRVSISSDVCGTCHGEPPRHGRYQQWEESGHANFELAIEEGEDGNCGRCHSGQGFLAWTKQDNDPTYEIPEDQFEALGMTPDKVQPQTCAVCHDPHYVGTVSGDTTDAPVRIMDDTPVLLAGFSANNVGKGAICLVCHNSRRGLRNDANPPTSYRAPHEPTQADVLMGQNAFFVQVGQRSSHANLKDSCVACHMQATPPPAGFSYNQSGTNHNFAASITICSQCHTGLNGLALQGSTELMLEDLNKAVGAAAVTKLNGLGSIIVSPIEPETEREASGDVTIDTSTSGNPLTAVEIAEGSRITLSMTLTNAITITYINEDSSTEDVVTNTFDVQMEFLRDGADNVVYALSGNMVRACWNYLLIKQDLSEGVHNPSFVSNVLITTTGKDLSF